MKEVLVYDGWLKVYEREIKSRKYEILKNHDAVSVLLQNEENDVMIVKQFRPAVMEETMEIPAGTMDVEGESPEDCILREIKEETGIYVQKQNLKKIVSYKPMMGFSGSTMHIFMARVKKEEFSLENLKDEEITSAMWVNFSEFQKYIETGRISDSKTLMAYYYISNEMKK